MTDGKFGLHINRFREDGIDLPTTRTGNMWLDDYHIRLASGVPREHIVDGQHLESFFWFNFMAGYVGLRDSLLLGIAITLEPYASSTASRPPGRCTVALCKMCIPESLKQVLDCPGRQLSPVLGASTRCFYPTTKREDVVAVTREQRLWSN